MNNKSNRSTSWLLIALLLIIGLLFFFSSSSPTEISYSDFQSLLRADAVKEVSISEGLITASTYPNRLTSAGLTKEKMDAITKLGVNQNLVTTGFVNDPSLIQEMENRKINFSFAAKNQWFESVKLWLIPFLLFFIAW